MKRISRFQPVAALGRERSERHYSEVHHRFARRMFREEGEHLKRYVANRAVAQYDLDGGFGEEPAAWRFVIVEVSDDMPGAAGFLPEHLQELIWLDHRKCIERIEGSEVDERVVVDRRSGQMSFAKYLFIHAAVGGSGARCAEPAARARYYEEAHLPALAAAFASAYGARLLLSNVVRRQAATSDDFGAGAAYTGGYQDAPSLLAFEELYFDNDDWGDEFFADRRIRSLMRDSPLGRAEGYKVVETVGVDKR